MFTSARITLEDVRIACLLPANFRQRLPTGSTIVYPYDDSTLKPVELGASIFVKANKILWRASEEFNLTRIGFSDEEEPIGFWDGQQFVFTVSRLSSALSASWFNAIADQRKVRRVWLVGLAEGSVTVRHTLSAKDSEPVSGTLLRD